MKRIILTYSLLLGGLFVSSPLMAQHSLESGATVKGTHVFRLRDSVIVEMQIDLTDMQVKSNRSVVLIPTLSRGNQSLTLPSVEVMGHRRTLYYKRNGLQPYADNPYLIVTKDKKEAQSVDYRIRLPYTEWMDHARLGMSEDLCGCGETTPGNPTPLHEFNIEYIPFLSYISPRMEMEKSRELSGEAYLDFVVDRTDINPAYRRNPEELSKIRTSIDTIYNDADFSITRISIKGYASPEGTYAHNTDLAQGRTLALKEYIKAKYGFEDSLFITDFVPENWDNLRKYVAVSPLIDKEGILALIDSDMEPDLKEHTLRDRYPESYRILLRDCYPGLRRTIYKIDYTIRGFDVEEAKDILLSNPEKLSLKEMFAVAQTYETGSPEFVGVFETAARIYPDDPVANLNMANALLTKGDATSALPYLSKAGDSAEAENARGVAALLLKRYDEAELHLRNAVKLGLQEAEKNLRVVVESENK